MGVRQDKTVDVLLQAREAYERRRLGARVRPAAGGWRPWSGGLHGPGDVCLSVGQC